MSPSLSRAANLLHCWIRRLLGVAVALAVVGTSAVLTAIPARADFAVSEPSFTIRGAGWGHGWGMSQYGAYGAARKGLSWKQILAFYYPGTRLAGMAAGTKIKVWITADNDSSLRVLPATGLTVRDTAGHRYTVPIGTNYTSWRIGRSGTGYLLSYRTSRGTYVTKWTGLTTGTWSFSTRVRDRQGGAPEWFSASLQRDCGADQEWNRRAHGQRGAARALRKGRRTSRDAHLLGSQCSTRPGGRGTVVRGPAAEVLWTRRIPHLRHHGLSDISRHE